MRPYPFADAMRRYPFAMAPLLIALTLLLHAAAAHLKPSVAPVPQGFAAIHWPD